MIATAHLIGLTVTVPLFVGLLMMCLSARKGGFIDKEPFWVFIATCEAVLALLLGVQAHSDAMQTGHVSTISQLVATVLLALTAGTVVLAVIVVVEHRRRGAALEALEGGPDGE